MLLNLSPDASMYKNVVSLFYLYICADIVITLLYVNHFGYNVLQIITV